VISFRYHIVTIIAIFLALAIGLLGGAAFVQPALQEQLQDRTDELLRNAADLRGQIDELRQEIAGFGRFSDAVRPYLTSGRLTGTPVVLVTQAGVEDEVLAQAQSALDEAGARVVASVSATEELVSDDPATQEQLALMLDAPTVPAEDLPGRTAQALAQRLANPQVIGDDLLTELLTAGFLAPVGPGPSSADLEEIGAPGQVVVVLSGGRGDGAPALAPEAFAVPLVDALAGLDVPVAAGESLLSDYPYVSLVRSAGIEGKVTVDDLDRTMGGAALVLGIQELLTTGSGGAYGVKDGAQPLPSAP
jgi:copper transport outer membrane protein MctB